MNHTDWAYVLWSWMHIAFGMLVVSAAAALLWLIVWRVTT